MSSPSRTRRRPVTRHLGGSTTCALDRRSAPRAPALPAFRLRTGATITLTVVTTGKPVVIDGLGVSRS